MEDFSRSLPIYKHESQILQSIRNNKVTIISGDTGCGKTTQLPKMIFKNFKLFGKKIAITQPRSISAMSVAERVAKELKVK